MTGCAQILAVFSWGSAPVVWASQPASALDSGSEAAPSKPEVHLDHLSFPQDVLGAKAFEQHLKKVLKRETNQVDWGAEGGNRIEYRFSVTELRYTVTDGTLHVHCSALGRLPKGKTAKSRLSFGGHPGERDQLTKRVLEIVARGVVTRLAELERIRRGLR